jgi:hypothetical protein
MKKLIVLIAAILIAGLLSGCWLFPEQEKTITITWFEDAIRYNPDGTEHSRWHNDPLGPATLIQDNGGWCFADVSDFFNDPTLEYSGIVFIDETGKLSGNAAYILDELPIENIFVGQVEIVVDEDETSGTMIGTYTQFKYAFGTEDEVEAIYPKAVECVDEGKWFVQYTDYITYPR